MEYFSVILILIMVLILKFNNKTLWRLLTPYTLFLTRSNLVLYMRWFHIGMEYKNIKKTEDGQKAKQKALLPNFIFEI